MGTLQESDLANYAPNVVVSVGTPLPVFTPVAITDGIAPPKYIYEIFDLASKGLDPIDKDTTRNLALWARQGKVNFFYIKFYGNVGSVITKTTTTTTTTTTAGPDIPLPPTPPPPPQTFTTTDARNAIPDISQAPDFISIAYTPYDLVGVKPPVNPKKSPPPPPSATGTTPAPTTTTPAPTPKSGTSWSPLELSSLPYFEMFPSAIYIPAVSSCISAPYFAPEAKRHLNGVRNNSGNASQANTCYQWEVNTRGTGEEFPNLIPRTDGAIILNAQRKDATKPYAGVFLETQKCERKFGIKNGYYINAFALIFGIQSGGNENQPQAAGWSLTITFGDLKLVISEGTPQISVKVQAKGGFSPSEKVDIKPSTASYVTENFGERAYLLTFIPVWNGILVSHGVPASSDWGATISYIPKDRSFNINEMISAMLTEKQTPQQKEKGIDPLPPKITVTRGGKQYNAPGVFLKGKKQAQVGKKGDKNYQAQSISNSDFNMGSKVNLSFFRCGGVFKFVPIWFTPYSKYHYVFPGAADPDDIPKESPARRPSKNPKRPGRDVHGALSGGGPRKPTPLPPGQAGPPKPAPTPSTPPPKAEDPTTIPSNPDVFEVTSKNNKIVMPILNFSATDALDFRTHLTTIVKSASQPFSCVSLEVRNVQPDVRRPIQIWGVVIAAKPEIDTSPNYIPPVNGEGFLTVDDLPDNGSGSRIKRFSISRSLDGANGEIIWDRNDPSGLVDRPPQRIGAIRVGISGGANTIYNGQSTSGIVFTGLAMGNSQEDSPDDNSVRIPLRGREAKMDSDGGIVALNLPFFDGWDHRAAMMFLANFVGVPIDTSLAGEFRLISSLNNQNPIIDIPMGTGINQAMDTVTKQSGSLFFFDRFGVLHHIDAETSSGNRWYYPDVNLESFSDEPDFQFMRNEVIIRGLVALPGARAQISSIKDPEKLAKYSIPTELMVVRVPVTTIPSFPWSRQAVYQIPQLVESRSEMIRLAMRITEATARPRATARCQIPPNAHIELFDLLNDNWIITSISHEADTQSKKWTMTVGVEMFVGAAALVGDPLVKFESQDKV